MRVTPRAGRDTIDGLRDGILHVRVTAAPADGAATAATVRLVARHLAVPATAVRLVAGARSRTKILEVVGLDLVPPPPPGRA